MFFVELSGLFGARYAADNFNRFMSMLCTIFRACGIAGLKFYVDNLDTVRKKEEEAKECMARLVVLAGIINLNLHEFLCAQRGKHLGWMVDTERWTVGIPEERLEVVLELLGIIMEATAMPVQRMQSFIGLFQWLAQVIFWMRPVIAVLREGTEAARKKGRPVGVSLRVRTMAGWAKKMLVKKQGVMQIRAFWRQGLFDENRLHWIGDEDVVTIVVDANDSWSGRAWLVVKPERHAGIHCFEDWTMRENQKLRSKEGVGSSPQREMYNGLRGVTGVWRGLGYYKVHVVADCKPASNALMKGWSDTEEMQAVLEEWYYPLLEEGVRVTVSQVSREKPLLMAVDFLARGQVQKAARLLKQVGGPELRQRRRQLS